MGQLSVQRWKRYGHDRWYVNDEGGATVGWLDTKSGELHLEDATMTRQVLDALAPVAADLIGARRDGAAPAAAKPLPPPTEEPYAVQVRHHDLGGHAAGRSAAEQATAARAAAPVKTLAARVLGVHTDERAWRVGAQGERKVAVRLAKLPDGWHVLHAVLVGDRGADIDHVVIGPAGVFTVNAKHHPNANVWVGGNTVMVNGRKVPYVRNARHEAHRASRLLSTAVGWRVEARGVVAMVGAAKGFTVKEQPSDVTVVARRRLARWLQNQPDRLSSPDVEDLHRVARRSDTWSG